jgi:Mor family transcriptional regulator
VNTNVPLSEFSEELLRESMPESMRDLLRIVTLQDVLKIIQEYGGTKLYFPSSPVPDKGLGKLIGMQSATALGKYCGGVAFDIPTLHMLRTKVRRNGVIQHLLAGAKISETARIFGMTARNVVYIKKQYKDRERAAMQYKVLSPIKRDGVRYQSGDTIDLTEYQAAPLLQDGAIEPLHRPFAAGKLSIDLTPGA